MGEMMKNFYREIELDEQWASLARAPREARLPEFIGGPAGAGERIGELRVAIVGVGSVGQVLAAQLSRLGIAEICLIDNGTCKPASLQTHSLTFPEDVGLPKASLMGRRIKNLSPDTRVLVYDGAVSDLGLSALARSHLVALASDNVLCEVEVGRYCRLLGIPLVQSSLFGAALVAQVRIIGNDPTAEGPCLRCGLGSEEIDALNSQTKFSCEGGPAKGGDPQTTGPVTSSLSSLCSLAGDLGAMLIVRHWLGLGQPVADTMLEYCGYTHQTTVSHLVRNSRCAGAHEVCRRVSSHHDVSVSSPRQLLMAAGLATSATLDGVSFKLDGHAFCVRGRCACPVSSKLGCFYSTGGGESVVCPKCKEPLRPQPYFIHDPVPASLLEESLDRKFSDLGVVEADWALVRGHSGAVLVGA
jgi:molybdopterin/thiamine biosynthesis adenylyltransferase